MPRVVPHDAGGSRECHCEGRAALQQQRGWERRGSGCPHHTQHLDTALPAPSTAWHPRAEHGHGAAGFGSMVTPAPATAPGKWRLGYQDPLRARGEAGTGARSLPRCSPSRNKLAISRFRSTQSLSRRRCAVWLTAWMCSLIVTNKSECPPK